MRGPYFFFLFAVRGLWSCKGLALWREKLPVGTPRDSRARGEGRARGPRPPRAEPPRRDEGPGPPGRGSPRSLQLLSLLKNVSFYVPSLGLCLGL